MEFSLRISVCVYVCVWECVCVWEREREWKCVCVCLCLKEIEGKSMCWKENKKLPLWNENENENHIKMIAPSSFHLHERYLSYFPPKLWNEKQTLEIWKVVYGAIQIIRDTFGGRGSRQCRQMAQGGGRGGQTKCHMSFLRPKFYYKSLKKAMFSVK